jgi:hypothetical protein
VHAAGRGDEDRSIADNLNQTITEGTFGTT